MWYRAKRDDSITALCATQTQRGRNSRKDSVHFPFSILHFQFSKSYLPSKASVTGSTPAGSPSDCAGPTAARRFFWFISSAASSSLSSAISTCGTRTRASLPAAPTPIPAAECPRDGHRDIPRRMRRRSAVWHGVCRAVAADVGVALGKSLCGCVDQLLERQFDDIASTSTG